MSQKETVLKKDYEAKLYDYQSNRINQIYKEFIEMNASQNEYRIQSCPKCGIENPVTIRGGFSNSGKQLLRCQACNKRFVEDTGRLTFYSHQDSGMWSDFIKATLELKSLKESAALIDVHERTAFRMRHKLLSFIEAANALEIEEDPLANEIEFDETYYHEMHKGLEPKEIVKIKDQINLIDNYNYDTYSGYVMAMKHRDELEAELHQKRKELKEKKRGISSDLVCVVTGVERLGNAVIKATNMAKPSTEDIRKISDTFENKSYVFIDGSTAYLSILSEKECDCKVCPSKESYDKVNHLNNVNSLHSKMNAFMRKYRGVSTIYINRYNALFRCLHEFASCDIQEMTVKLIHKLSKIHHHFFSWEINCKNIFDDPQVIANRRKRIDQFTHRRWLADDRELVAEIAY